MLRHGRVPTDTFMSIVNCLLKGIPTLTRTTMERIFNNILPTFTADEKVDPALALCLLSMVGYFDLTSHEEEIVEIADAMDMGIGGSAASGDAKGKTKRKTPPPMEPWCEYVMNEIPVDAIHRMELADVLGSGILNQRNRDAAAGNLAELLGRGRRGRRGMMDLLDTQSSKDNPLQSCMNGIAEAVERAAEHGSYNWLRVMPVLSKSRTRGSEALRVPDKLKSENGSQFQEMAGIIRAMVTDQDAVTDQLQPKIVEDRRRAVEALKRLHDELTRTPPPIALQDGTSVESPQRTLLNDQIAHCQEEIERLGRELPSAGLSRMWMEALVEHAPSAKQLELLKGKEINRHSAEVLNQFRWRVEGFNFKVQDDLVHLNALLKDTPGLHHPKIAAAILQNKSLDDSQLAINSLELVSLCVASKVHGSAGKNIPDMDDDVKFFVSCADRWVSRRHQEGADVKRAKAASLGRSGGGHAPKKDAERLVQDRLQALTAAVGDVEALLEVPILNTVGVGVLMAALRKCHFLQGNRLHTLRALCRLGRTKAGYDNVSDHMRNELQTRATTLIRDAIKGHKTTLFQELMEVGVDLEKIEEVLDILETELTAKTQLSYHLTNGLLNASLPQDGQLRLPSLLQNEKVWNRVIKSTDWKDKDRALAQHPLGNLLRDMENILTTTAANMTNDTVTVRDLRWTLVKGGSDAFKSLLGGFQLKFASSATAVMASLEKKLQKFDRYHPPRAHTQTTHTSHITLKARTHAATTYYHHHSLLPPQFDV